MKRRNGRIWGDLHGSVMRFDGNKVVTCIFISASRSLATFPFVIVLFLCINRGIVVEAATLH